MGTGLPEGRQRLDRLHPPAPELRQPRYLTSGHLQASVPLDLADEGARALVGRVLEDRGRRPLLHDQRRRP